MSVPIITKTGRYKTVLGDEIEIGSDTTGYNQKLEGQRPLWFGSSRCDICRGVWDSSGRCLKILFRMNVQNKGNLPSYDIVGLLESQEDTMFNDKPYQPGYYYTGKWVVYLMNLPEELKTLQTCEGMSLPVMFGVCFSENPFIGFWDAHGVNYVLNHRGVSPNFIKNEGYIIWKNPMADSAVRLDIQEDVAESKRAKCAPHRFWSDYCERKKVKKYWTNIVQAAGKEKQPEPAPEIVIDSIGVYVMGDGESVQLYNKVMHPELPNDCDAVEPCWMGTCKNGSSYMWDSRGRAYGDVTFTPYPARNIVARGKGVIPPDAKEHVNHPAHYNQGKIEVIDFIDDQKLGFTLGNAVKYICRAEHKGKPLEDLKKAAWYIAHEIKKIEVARDDLN